MRNNLPNQCLSLKEIKEFLKKNISDREQVDYTNHFVSCELCKEVKDSFATVNQLGVEEDISDLKEDVFEKVNQRISASRRVFLRRIAAGILLPFTGIATFFYWSSTTEKRLYEEYYQPFILSDETNRSGEGISQYDNVSLPKNLAPALELYKAGKYKASLPHFKAYQKIQSKNTFANFLYAMANLEENNLDVAINTLEKIRLTDTNLKVDAVWYLALANLKKKNKIKATQLLEEIITNGHGFYGPKAEALKMKL